MSWEHLAATTTHEVWRTHMKGGPDRLVQANLNLEQAETLAAECRKDLPREVCRFYVVVAETHRYALEDPELES